MGEYVLRVILGFFCFPCQGHPASKGQKTFDPREFYCQHHPRPIVKWCDWKGLPTTIVGYRSSPVMVSNCEVLASPKDTIFATPHLSFRGNSKIITMNGGRLLPKEQQMRYYPSLKMRLMYGRSFGILKAHLLVSITTHLPLLPGYVQIAPPARHLRILSPPRSEKECAQVLCYFGGLLAKFNHPIWRCLSLWNQASPECVMMKNSSTCGFMTYCFLWTAYQISHGTLDWDIFKPFATIKVDMIIYC